MRTASRTSHKRLSFRHFVPKCRIQELNGKLALDYVKPGTGSVWEKLNTVHAGVLFCYYVTSKWFGRRVCENDLLLIRR